MSGPQLPLFAIVAIPCLVIEVALTGLDSLAVACTAIALPGLALIARIGARSLVGHASPVVAVALGVASLDQQLARPVPLGLALILAASWPASRVGSATEAEAAPRRRAGGKPAGLAVRT